MFLKKPIPKSFTFLVIIHLLPFWDPSCFDPDQKSQGVQLQPGSSEVSVFSVGAPQRQPYRKLSHMRLPVTTQSCSVAESKCDPLLCSPHHVTFRHRTLVQPWSQSVKCQAVLWAGFICTREGGNSCWVFEQREMKGIHPQFVLWLRRLPHAALITGSVNHFQS